MSKEGSKLLLAIILAQDYWSLTGVIVLGFSGWTSSCRAQAEPIQTMKETENSYHVFILPSQIGAAKISQNSDQAEA